MVALSTLSVDHVNGTASATEIAELEEIRVSARKREESLHIVPLSVVAFDAAAIEGLDLRSTQSLADFTPGFEFAESASLTSSRPMIRGSTQIARGNDEPNVAVFVDGVYSPGFSGASQGFDGIERIEILRGPQSALYGRDSFAGAINYVTKKPRDEFESGFRATYGEYGRRDLGGYVSGPLVPGRFALRLDAGTGESGSTFRNRIDGSRLNNREHSFARLSFTANPTDILHLSGSLHWSDEESSGRAVTPIPDDSPLRVGKPAPTSRTPVQVGRRVLGAVTYQNEEFYVSPLATAGDREFIRAILSATLDVGRYTLTSLTGYETRDVFSAADLGTTPEGTPLGDTIHRVLTGDLQDRDHFSQDLRLESPRSDRFRWTLGAYYSSESYQEISHRMAMPGHSSAPEPLPGNQPHVNDETFHDREIRAAYAAVEYDLADAVRLSVEGRYTEDEKDANNTQANFGRGATPWGHLDLRESYFTPRLIVSYFPSSNSHFYASVAEGAIAGGLNPEAIVEEELRYRAETNVTYEIGGKFRLLDGHLHLNSAIYLKDWRDQQINVFATDADGETISTSITGNAGDSEVRGFELDGIYQATEWLRLNFAYALTDAEYKRATMSNFAGFVDCEYLVNLECIAAEPGATPETTGRVDGNKLEFISKHKVSLGAQVNLPITETLEFLARGDFSYGSKRYLDAGNIGWIPGRETVRARVGVVSESYGVYAFCNNLTDDRTPELGFASRDVLGNPHYYVSNREGRMCGLTVDVTF